MKIAAYLTGLWQGGHAGLPSRFLLMLLYLPSLIYCAGMGLRGWCYRVKVRTVHRLTKPVISVGNLTVGGTGKTPVTDYIARYLLARGLQVVVLSRGYGGSLEGQSAVVSDGKNIFLTPEACGDEPYLLASTVKGLAVVIGSKRYQAGLLAMEQINPDVFLLDDGFQHLRLHRDLNILLLDCDRPFGNGCILPAGPLREPKSALQRADFVIHTRCKPGQNIGHGLVNGLPECQVCYQPGSFYRMDTGEALPLKRLETGRILACAGIAHPTSFFDLLAGSGVIPHVTLPLPDHTSYTASILQQINSLIAEHRIDWLLATEKDAVKLLHHADDLKGVVLVAVKLELGFEREEVLLQALDKVLSKQA